MFDISHGFFATLLILSPAMISYLDRAVTAAYSPHRSKLKPKEVFRTKHKNFSQMEVFKKKR